MRNTIFIEQYTRYSFAFITDTQNVLNYSCSPVYYHFNTQVIGAILKTGGKGGIYICMFILLLSVTLAISTFLSLPQVYVDVIIIIINNKLTSYRKGDLHFMKTNMDGEDAYPLSTLQTHLESFSPATVCISLALACTHSTKRENIGHIPNLKKSMYI